jgi:hypothetical protein
MDSDGEAEASSDDPLMELEALKHKKPAMFAPKTACKFGEDEKAKAQNEAILAEFEAKRAAAKEKREKKKEAKEQKNKVIEEAKIKDAKTEG